jgi:hypothetical protein
VLIHPTLEKLAALKPAALVERIIRMRNHPWSCLGRMRSEKIYGEVRQEAVFVPTIHIQTISPTNIKSILKTCLDHEPLRPTAAPIPIDHDNLRGGESFEGGRLC